MTAAPFAFGSLNVHRADCDRKHANPCDHWDKRVPNMVKFMKDKMRCSIYAVQECLPRQAFDITIGLGWGTSKNPAFFVDENFNAILIDRKKWRDIDVRENSLSFKAGDKGDVNRRSIIWVHLEHLETKQILHAFSSHLETGDPNARVIQTKALVNTDPDGPFVGGVDRNSYTTDPGQPRDIFNHNNFKELKFDNPSKERSFNGFGKPEYDGKCIDSQYYRGVTCRGGRLVSTVGLRFTDHSGLVGNYTVGK